MIHLLVARLLLSSRTRRIIPLAILSVVVLATLPVTHAYTNGQNASLVLGHTNFTTSTHATTQNGLWNPSGEAFDSSGNLWVAETSNRRVLEYTCAATNSCTNGNNAALVLGQSTFTTNTFAVTQNGLAGPFGVVFDSHGNLWVADTNANRVLEYTCTATSSCTNGNNAALVLGQTTFTGSTPATTQGRFDQPTGVVFDSYRYLWVADASNERVLGFTCTATSCTNGNNAALVLGQTTFSTQTINKGSGFGSSTCNIGDGNVNPCGLFLPWGLASDLYGNLWVADNNNQRVLQFTCTVTGSCGFGNSAVLVLGQPNLTSNSQGTTQNRLSYPLGVVSDSHGNIWVGDTSNQRVLEFASPGIPVNQIVGDVIQSAANRAWVIMPDYTITVDSIGHTSAAKCNVVAALVTDTYATYGLTGSFSSKQNLILDTNSAYVSQSTCGQPLTNSSQPIVVIAGMAVNEVTYYYTDVTGQSQLYYNWGTGCLVRRDTGLNIVCNPWISQTRDYFVIDSFRDSEGRYVYLLWGWAWRGTLASTEYTVDFILKNPSLYKASWYVYTWNDATTGPSANGLPDAGDTFTQVAVP